MHDLLTAIDFTALWLTLRVAGWATLIATLAGVGLGFWLARHRFPGREWLDAVLTLPLVLPPTVLGYSAGSRPSAAGSPTRWACS
jgi:molybdate transport system permease protein